MRTLKPLNYLIIAFFVLFISINANAQLDSAKIRIDQIENSLTYQTGEIDFASCKAKLNVPEGFRFLDAEQSRYVLSDLWGNPVDSSILGLLVPADRGVLEPNSWVFTLTFDEIGYVKDNDAEDIDYEDLLKQMKQDFKDANPEREQLGYQPIEFIGWASKPYYDKEKKVLHWAKELKFGVDSMNTLNYNLRVLGKDGVFVLNAVATMRELNDVKPNIDRVLQSVDFADGSAYSDFNPEIDKVAAWTIGGLVAGKVLAKVGFFGIIAKFGKFIIIGLIASFAAVWIYIKRRKNEEESYDQYNYKE